MRRNGMGQKLLLFFLTAAMILGMYSFTALAEAETPEIPETAVLPEEPEESEETEMPKTLMEPEALEEPEMLELLTMSENSLTVSENTLTVSENLLTEIAPVNESGAASGLAASVLKEHIVRSRSPEGAVVNLFDYWQNSRKPEDEIVWDWEWDDTNDADGDINIKIGELCTLGISLEHLLRFGQTETGKEDDWNYGEWNRYSKGRPYQGIVQNTLGADGFPRLNFAGKKVGEFGNYATMHRDWLDDARTEESLAYLFSVTKQNSYKAIYKNVRGLFQMDEEGYYYYNSQKNFAEFDKANSRFILYDSPGVGSAADPNSGSAGNFGQFFPFNSASQVFNTVYESIDDDHPYLLSCIKEERLDGEIGETDIVRNGNASFLSCTYPALNHYIGMTLEVRFLQTVGGRLDGRDMIFEFSGDDDVWIFIDGVLVADLGGIHDAYDLSINFADGTVLIPSLGKEGNHTLRDSFEAAGRSVDDFSENTFADNTEHTLKMFYLERGHMASNLSLRFNVAVLEEPESNDPGGGNPGRNDPNGSDLGGNDLGDDSESLPSETENSEETPGTDSDTKEASAAHPAESEQVKNAIGSPQTGDDSLIGWWAVLSLISLLGIGATVCNMVLRRDREKKRG